MMPVGPLMIEHRLIERMIRVLRESGEKFRDTESADPLFIDTAIDFIRMYADRTHHGKEEDILFRDMANKELADDHKAMMEELIQDHIWARGKVRALVDAKERYQRGEDRCIGRNYKSDR